jgi:hypothetical protein
MDAHPIPDALVYLLIALVLIGLCLALASVRRALGRPDSRWSLANALSEEADLTVDPNGGPYGVNGAVVKETVLVASTSRLIALVGMLAIVALFIGFGTIELWAFAKTGTLLATTDILKFLVGGTTLFAPYVVNKFASAFASI